MQAMSVQFAKVNVYLSALTDNNNSRIEHVTIFVSKKILIET